MNRAEISIIFDRARTEVAVSKLSEYENLQVYHFSHFPYFQPIFAADNPRIIRLGVERGLSNNSIRCIFKDYDGFLWFGTYDGLNRYDGHAFKIFRNKLNDSFSPPHNYIYSINQDLQKNLWVGTGQGLCVYNNLTSKFSAAWYFTASGKREKITANVSQLVLDKKGNLFITA